MRLGFKSVCRGKTLYATSLLIFLSYLLWSRPATDTKTHSGGQQTPIRSSPTRFGWSIQCSSENTHCSWRIFGKYHTVSHGYVVYLKWIWNKNCIKNHNKQNLNKYKKIMSKLKAWGFSIEAVDEHFPKQNHMYLWAAVDINFRVWYMWTPPKPCKWMERLCPNCIVLTAIGGNSKSSGWYRSCARAISSRWWLRYIACIPILVV